MRPAWGALCCALLAGCPVPEAAVDGVVPPDPAPRRRGAATLDDSPRAWGGRDPLADLAPMPAPRGPPAAGSTRLQGEVRWELVGRDAVTIEVGLPQPHAPPQGVARVQVRAPGTWWLDLPMVQGTVVVSAWNDSDDDGPDVTDLAARPVEVVLTGGTQAGVDLLLEGVP